MIDLRDASAPAEASKRSICGHIPRVDTIARLGAMRRLMERAVPAPRSCSCCATANAAIGTVWMQPSCGSGRPAHHCCCVLERTSSGGLGRRRVLASSCSSLCRDMAGSRRTAWDVGRCVVAWSRRHFPSMGSNWRRRTGNRSEVATGLRHALACRSPEAKRARPRGRQAGGLSAVTISAFVVPSIGPAPNRASMTRSTASVASLSRPGSTASIAVRIIDP